RELLLGALAIRSLKAQQAGGGASFSRLIIVGAGGANVVAFPGADGLVLVDSGAPNSGEQLIADLRHVARDSKVKTLFNTHYHIDQTGNNEMFASAGAKIIAHERTRRWMSTDYWVPAEDRYEKARPKAAWPTEVFETAGSITVGPEQIDYGHLRLAH